MPYRVQNKYHSRIGEDGTVERFEVGDEIEPTESELVSFPDRFRQVETPVEPPVSPRRGRPPGVTSSSSEDKGDDV